MARARFFGLGARVVIVVQMQVQDGEKGGSQGVK
jgi:hypothetical protein